MNKPKLCPYCGFDQTTIRLDPRYGAAFVECDQCYAAGPSVFESDLMDGFVDTASEPEIKAALGELAVKRWNCRPPMTNMTPEELAEAEKKQWAEICERAKVEQERAEAEYMKTDSVALYGAYCREG